MPRSLSRAITVSLVLSACAATNGRSLGLAAPAAKQEQATALVDEAGLVQVPSCQQDATATLDNGLIVHYEGADLSDPQMCRVRWQRRSRRFFAGFWGSGRSRKVPAGERKAILDALTGPVGTKTTFQDTRAALWGRVTVEHVANPTLILVGRPHRTVELKIVRHDAFGRSNVRVSEHWVDRRTGILLKRQSITRLATGEIEPFTTWRVTEVRSNPS